MSCRCDNQFANASRWTFSQKVIARIKDDSRWPHCPTTWWAFLLNIDTPGLYGYNLKTRLFEHPVGGPFDTRPLGYLADCKTVSGRHGYDTNYCSSAKNEFACCRCSLNRDDNGFLAGIAAFDDSAMCANDSQLLLITVTSRLSILNWGHDLNCQRYKFSYADHTHTHTPFSSAELKMVERFWLLTCNMHSINQNPWRPGVVGLHRQIRPLWYGRSSTPVLCNAGQWWHRLARLLLDVVFARFMRSTSATPSVHGAL